jgi:hypothetical protein
MAGSDVYLVVVRLHILKATLSIAIVFAVSVMVGGRGTPRQHNQGIADCPTVAVSCPENVEGNSELHAYASFGGSGDKTKFQWTVTWPTGVRKGRIKSGQGTPSLVVSVPRRAHGSVTVTVKAIGWDPACPNESSCSTMIGGN